MEKHQHDFKEEGLFLICSICGIKRMRLEQKTEGLLIGTKSDGKKCAVRTNRKSWLMPEDYIKLFDSLKGERAKRTLNTMIQTGARINEAQHIEKRDCDWDRNTIKLRITKTKARKVGEERGSPRTIPINSEFMKYLKKFFKDKPDNASIELLSTPAFNIALKKNLKDIGIQDYYMFSSHNIRKTHGNYLKILSANGMIACDAVEICLRLGHDMNTFLSSYGSSGVMTASDLLKAKSILGDLYTKK